MNIGFFFLPIKADEVQAWRLCSPRSHGFRALISFEGNTASELVADFHPPVDEYLEMCAAEGKEPEKGYKGTFNVRISPELHRKAAMAALSQQITLNRFVEHSIEQAINH